MHDAFNYSKEIVFKNHKYKIFSNEKLICKIVFAI